MTAPAPLPLRLRPHQVRAVSEVRTKLADGGRGKLIMATGTGKTITCAAIALDLHCRLTLVVVPSRPLLAQTATEWERVFADRLDRVVAVCGAWDILAACSTEHTEVCTDPVRLAELGRAPGTTLVLTTYHSLPTLAAAHREGLPAFDLAVVDEAHHSASASTDHTWGQIHDDTRIRARRRLYSTATPVLYKPRRTPGRAVESVPAYSMDDPEVFGPELHRLSCGQAIADGLLSDYRTVVGVVSDTEIAALVGGGSMLRVGAYDIPAPMLAAQVALLRTIGTYDLRSVMTFHSGVDAARRFAATLPAVLHLLPAHERPQRPLTAHHVSGDTHHQARQRILARLGSWTDQTTVVSSARVLSTGIDVPSVDCIAPIDPGESYIQTAQRIGRGLRPHPHRTDDTIILVPVLTTTDTDPTATLSAASPFAHLWDVLSTLRSHDTRAATDLDTSYAHRFLTRRPGPRLPDGTPVRVRHSQGLPPWLTITGTHVDRSFADAIAIRALEATASPWWATFLLAQDFHHEHGHSYPPQDHPARTPNGGRLCSWLQTMRALYRQRRRLTPQQRRALESIDIDAPSPNTSVWARINLALSRTGDPAALAPELLHAVTTAYRSGGLSEEQAGRLREQGLAVEHAPRTYDRSIARLVHAHRTAGRLPDPAADDLTQDDRGLLNVRERLLTAWRKGLLEKDQEATLEGIGCEPQETVFEKADRRLDDICRTIEKHLASGKDLTELDKEMRQWIAETVHSWRQGGISAPRRRRLLQLGIHPDFSFTKAKWWKLFREAEKIPPGTIHSKHASYKWLDSQRPEKKWERLDSDQQTALKGIGVQPGSPMPARFRHPRSTGAARAGKDAR